ncbi:vacuolar segregation subunit 7-domain-containing protein [Elsinoe ampelina]|uniref:Vacuolar segregation subunit 7-domain-containing protein n=1 Tax=Elsinoe ampelina TaxID=302913 RepID=A0A6A6FZ40_9PEZI|nr:vacuolar segregation subunit 7-domain-containing protein [Elsinoe ampelina]
MEAGREGSQSVPGQPKTHDTAAVQTPQRQVPSHRDPSPTLRRDGSNTHIPSMRKQPSTNLVPSLPPSVSASPQTSRNTSPIRPSVRPQETPHSTAQRAAGIRSRKNSHDASPIRPVSTQSSAAPPSAAAIQRALSAAAVPQLHSNSNPVADAVSRLPRTSRTAPATESQTPVSPSFSPRVKSPGPSAPSSRRNSVPRKLDNLSAPPITVQNSTPPGTAVPDLKGDGLGDTGLVQTPKVSNRGPSGPKSNLETVQEATPPAGSVLGESTDQSFYSMNSSQTKSSDDDRTPNGTIHKKDTGNKSGESDGDGNRSDGKGRKDLTIDQNKAKMVSSKSAPATARAKQVDGTRNMTVETETVSSIPQSALSADRAAGPRGDPGGSIRLKPSNETIRPRKERKKAVRKAPSVHNGTASSKADIFEARVASQVDEANSSDSDETFVYESNPPEPQLRTNRNHSRTPSVTSIHSQSDRRLNLRAGYDNHRVAGKRSMKFSNNPYSALDSPTDDTTGMGTIRAHHPRNISRFGRTIGSNSSLYGGGEDSPFTQASKLRANLAAGGGGGGTRHSSRPNTPSQPKSAPAANQRFGPWRKDGAGLRQYDYDDAGEEGSDERTPLVGTVRTPRRYQRRRAGDPRYDTSNSGIYNLRQNSFLGRFGGCFLGLIIISLVIVGAVGVLFMSNRSLEEVQIEKIQNVLASEQEIMLDLVVGAVNPNLLGIGVGEMDLNIFAKSKYVATTTRDEASPTPAPTGFGVGVGVGTSAERRRAPRPAPIPEDDLHVSGQPWQDSDGHWHSGDEDDSLEGDSQTMLLGRVFHFDQGLYFDGTPLKRRRHFSTGEFRLAKPGNKTEAGGSARWERVLGYPFELILRGVVRYQLPVTNRDVAARVRGSVVVHPEGGRQPVRSAAETEDEECELGAAGLNSNTPFPEVYTSLSHHVSRGHGAVAAYKSRVQEGTAM